MLIAEISIVKNPMVLYQIPFEFSKHLSRIQKELFLDSCQFISKQVEHDSDATISAHPIEL